MSQSSQIERRSSKFCSALALPKLTASSRLSPLGAFVCLPERLSTSSALAAARLPAFLLLLAARFKVPPFELVLNGFLMSSAISPSAFFMFSGVSPASFATLPSFSMPMFIAYSIRYSRTATFAPT